MRRVIFVLCSVALLLAFAAPVAAAKPAPAGKYRVDQQQTAISSSWSIYSYNNPGYQWNDVRLAQLFTSGFKGRLTRVDLWLQRSGTPGPVQVLIYPADFIVTGSAALASAVIPESAIPTTGDWVIVTNWGVGPASLVAEGRYAIVLDLLNRTYVASDQIAWASQVDDPYNRGDGWLSNDYFDETTSTFTTEYWAGFYDQTDFAFRTYR